MSETHTIVVRFPEGVTPRYSAATEFQGGQVVAVDFDGNRLTVAQELEDALEALLALCEGEPKEPDEVISARTALAKAKGEQ